MSLTSHGSACTKRLSDSKKRRSYGMVLSYTTSIASTKVVCGGSAGAAVGLDGPTFVAAASGLALWSWAVAAALLLLGGTLLRLRPAPDTPRPLVRPRTAGSFFLPRARD